VRTTTSPRPKARAIYVDTSVWCAYCFNEEGSERAVRWLIEADMTQLGTSWWGDTEFASALAIQLRSKSLKVPQARLAQERYAESMDMVRRLNVIEADFREAASACLRVEKLRGGDALHLAIAQRHGCTALATLDKDMQTVAQKMGFELAEWT
jgi:predicted nucleic acid-binding protein